MASDEEIRLEDELSENLDFLEEDDLEPSNAQAGAPVDSAGKFSLDNLPRKPILLGSGLLLAVIIFYIMPSNKPTSQTIAPKLTPLPKSTDTTQAAAPSQVAQPSSANTNNINQQSSSKPATESNTTSPEPTLEKISQIPSHTPENPNLTWEELKQSINQPQPNDQNNFFGDKPTQPNDIAVSGFENPKPIRDTAVAAIPTIQNNINTKTQEHIQELKTIINNITEELTANVKQIKELQNNLNEISQSIYRVNNNVTGVDSKISTLSGTVDNLSLDLKNVKRYIQEDEINLTAQHLKPSEPDLFSSTPEYTVHAIIPGRAWLKSSNGQTITVTEGDHLGDYGKIAFIDPHNNIVRTSSGVIFR